MPTLTRLLLALIVLIVLVYSAMITLVYLVKPVTTDITIEIQPENLHLRDRSAVLENVTPQQPANDKSGEMKTSAEQSPDMNDRKIDQQNTSMPLKNSPDLKGSDKSGNEQSAVQQEDNKTKSPATYLPSKTSPSKTKKDDK
ncbi:hypothetical protein [uncultured Bartonella sp.]|uniref:hypothetical protein n=1 Tax=uncultured Bartonella sp. TaxID=104108 RepID=UPI0025F7465F|nr:hypothetical protein [uncultured Bartonella sp.]